MATNIALSVLEISAILLSLLFVALQYLSRQVEDDLISTSLLAEASQAVARGSILLLTAAYFSWMLLVLTVENSIITIVIAPLLAAFAYIAAAIQETGKQLADTFDEDGDEAGDAAKDKKSPEKEADKGEDK